jgi:hypothetical protein
MNFEQAFAPAPRIPRGILSAQGNKRRTIHRRASKRDTAQTPLDHPAMLVRHRHDVEE